MATQLREWANPGEREYTILEKEIFTHVLTNISDYRRLILKKLVTKLKPFKFASDLRKPHLSNSMRSKVI